MLILGSWKSTFSSLTRPGNWRALGKTENHGRALKVCLDGTSAHSIPCRCKEQGDWNWRAHEADYWEVIRKT